MYHFPPFKNSTHKNLLQGIHAAEKMLCYRKNYECNKKITGYNTEILQVSTILIYTGL